MAYITGRLDVRNGTFGVSQLRSVTANGTLGAAIVNGTELGYLDGVTSAIQTQFTGKAAATGYTASRLMQSNANGTLAISPITITANGTLSGNGTVAGLISSSNINLKLNGTGTYEVRVTNSTGTEVFSVNNSGLIDTVLTASRVVVTAANGTLTTSAATTPTELGYVNGVTSAIQTQLNNKVANVYNFANGTATTTNQLCYVNTNGSAFLTDADAESTTGAKLLVVASVNGTKGTTKAFYLPGARITGTGFPNGSEVFVSTTAGGITGTKPTGGSDCVRSVGYTNGTTVWWFYPSNEYYVV
jgi:hypothetical protein